MAILCSMGIYLLSFGPIMAIWGVRPGKVGEPRAFLGLIYYPLLNCPFHGVNFLLGKYVEFWMEVTDHPFVREE